MADTGSPCSSSSLLAISLWLNFMGLWAWWNQMGAACSAPKGWGSRLLTFPSFSQWGELFLDGELPLGPKQGPLRGWDDAGKLKLFLPSPSSHVSCSTVLLKLKWTPEFSSYFCLWKAVQLWVFVRGVEAGISYFTILVTSLPGISLASASESPEKTKVMVTQYICWTCVRRLVKPHPQYKRGSTVSYFLYSWCFGIWGLADLGATAWPRIS